MEFIEKMNGGLQELDETAYWLDVIVESEMMERARPTELQKETRELIAIFVTMIKNARNRD